MDLDALITGLGSPQPDARLTAARIIGMVDETRTLEALKQAYVNEDAPPVRQAMSWAGKRLARALDDGFSTEEAIFRYFGVHREIVGIAPTPEEAQAMAEQERREADQLRRMQADQDTSQIGLNAAKTMNTLLSGSPLLTMGMALSANTFDMQSNQVDLASRLPETSKKRARAVQPATTDIRAWVRRLKEEKDPAQRKKAALELASLHNPEALPALAQAFAADLNADVCQAAQRSGKILYWNVLYWQMEQDGSLQREMDRRIAHRRQSAGSLPPPEVAPPPPPASPEDIAAILRKAEEARNRRNRSR